MSGPCAVCGAPPVLVGAFVCADHASRAMLAAVISAQQAEIQRIADLGTANTLRAAARALRAEKALAVAQHALAELQGCVRRARGPA